METYTPFSLFGALMPDFLIDKIPLPQSGGTYLQTLHNTMLRLQKRLDVTLVEDEIPQLTNDIQALKELFTVLGQPASIDRDPIAYGSGDGHWVLANDLPSRPDKDRFTEKFYGI